MDSRYGCDGRIARRSRRALSRWESPPDGSIGRNMVVHGSELGKAVVTNDILCAAARHGWATTQWEPSRSLHELVDALNLQTRLYELHAAKRSTSLVAKPRAIARSGSKSAKRGLTMFPPHTDGASHREPPHYLVLRCVTAPCEFPTYLVSRDTLPLDDELQLGLSSGIWVCRGSAQPHLSAVIEGRRIRWDEDCMRPLDRIARRMHDQFRNLLNAAAMYQHSWRDRSTVLVIDNWNTLHARGHIRNGNTRQLERLYVGSS